MTRRAVFGILAMENAMSVVMMQRGEGEKGREEDCSQWETRRREKRETVIRFLCRRVVSE